jgi:hypothetical protein
MAERDEQKDAGQGEAARGEPLPIWFFVGGILLVYGILVLLGGLFGGARHTILAETRPSLWWGAVIVVFGAIFFAVGLRSRRRPAPKGGAR